MGPGALPVASILRTYYRADPYEERRKAISRETPQSQETPQSLENSEQRTFFRVKGAFAVHYRKITEEEHELLGERLNVELSFPESPSYRYLPTNDQEPYQGGLERLVPLFQELSYKLDMVVDLLLSRDEGWEEPQGRVIDISGSGLRFKCKEEFGADSFLEMRFQLPGQWGRHIQCAARVLRSDRCEEGWAVACELTHICEADRERIIQHTFQVSSKILRANREEQGVAD